MGAFARAGVTPDVVVDPLPGAMAGWARPAVFVSGAGRVVVLVLLRR